MKASVEVSSLYGFGVAGVSFIVFLLLHVLVLIIGVPGYINQSDRWKWKNLFISWLHSIGIGIVCIYSLFAFPDLLKDMIDFSNFFTFIAVAASTGYFVCDAFDIVVGGQTGAMWEVLLHHAGVLSIFVYNIAERRYIGYTIIALVVEVNSIFLHLRKLMQMAGVSFKHPVYRIVTILNLVSFVGCRFVFSLSLITYGLVVYSDRMSTLYYYLLSATMFVMWVVNTVLFWRLIKNDLLRGRRKSATTKPEVGKTALGKPAAATNNNNNKCNDGEQSANKVDEKLL